MIPWRKIPTHADMLAAEEAHKLTLRVAKMEEVVEGDAFTNIQILIQMAEKEMLIPMAPTDRPRPRNITAQEYRMRGIY